MYKCTWKLSKMCTQLCQDFGKKNVKLQNSFEKTKTQPTTTTTKKENNPYAETMKCHQCNFACGCYARLHRDYLWHWALQLAVSCITHLNNKQHFTAAGLEPGQCSLPLTLPAVFCENAPSHFKTKGRRWSKGNCWGKGEKYPTKHQSCTSKRHIHNFFQNLLSKFLFYQKGISNTFSPGGSIFFFLPKSV